MEKRPLALALLDWLVWMRKVRSKLRNRWLPQAEALAQREEYDRRGGMVRALMTRSRPIEPGVTERINRPPKTTCLHGHPWPASRGTNGRCQACSTQWNREWLALHPTYSRDRMRVQRAKLKESGK